MRLPVLVALLLIVPSAPSELAAQRKFSGFRIDSPLYTVFPKTQFVVRVFDAGRGSEGGVVTVRFQDEGGRDVDVQRADFGPGRSALLSAGYDLFDRGLPLVAARVVIEVREKGDFAVPLVSAEMVDLVVGRTLVAGFQCAPPGRKGANVGPVDRPEREDVTLENRVQRRRPTDIAADSGGCGGGILITDLP